MIVSFGTFFFEIYEGKIFIVDFLGNLYVVNDLKHSTSTENLKSDLKAKRVYDTLIIEDNLYISNDLNQDLEQIKMAVNTHYNTWGKNYIKSFTYAHFSGPPAIPITLQPYIFPS